MKINVFYSWQSDLPGKFNRSFIEECIEKAIQSIQNQNDYSIDYSLDRDTKGLLGTPDIANTIFDKIKETHIFIGDISIINSQTDGRKCPNPNVLLELGYAASVVGWENIVCVYNTTYGKIEELPFDLRFRRPLSYSLNDSNYSDKSSIKKHLVSSFEKAIKEANPNYAYLKRKVVKEYSGESELAQKLAIEKPNFWEFKLMEELLRNRLGEINKRYFDYEEGRVFKRMVRMNGHGFISHLQTASRNLSIMFKTLEKTLSDFVQSQAPPGIAGDPIVIKDAVDKLHILLNDFVDWEIEISSIEVSGIAAKLKASVLGSVKKLIIEINKIPEEIKKCYAKEKPEDGIVRVKIDLDNIIDTKQSSIILEMITKNPGLISPQD